MARSDERIIGAAVGLLLERMVGQLPAQVHPVARFGQGMGALERWLYADSRAAGAMYAAAGAGLGVAAGVVLRSSVLATGVAAAGRALGDEATKVGDALSHGDLPAARAALPALVGRDPDTLDPEGISRAVVESVAENTVDAVVAPGLWGAALGAPGVLAHRAVNTMDAMVGYRDARYERFGWAAARLDDAAAWAPARLTACLVAACRPATAPQIWAVVRRDASAHPSPNAGVAEAAFAAALGLRLGGPASYGGRTELRPSLGDGRAPGREDIARAVRLSRDVTIALAALLAGSALWRWSRR